MQPLVPAAGSEGDYTGTAVALPSDSSGIYPVAWGDRNLYTWSYDSTAGAWVEGQTLDAGLHAFTAGDADALDGSAPGPAGAARGALLVSRAPGRAVRVWRRTGAVSSAPWELEAVLSGNTADPDEAFGAAVAAAGDYVVVGAAHNPPGFPDPEGGRAYVFRYTGSGPMGGWEREAVLEQSPPLRFTGNFVAGWSSADGLEALATSHEGGRIHVFRRQGGPWATEALFELSAYGAVGFTADMTGRFVFVRHYMDGERGQNAGAVWVADVPVIVPASQGPAPAGGLALAVAPNPSRGAARLTLTLPAAGDVRVELLDVLGRVVRMVHAGSLPAEARSLSMDVSSLAAGAYVVRACAAGACATTRVSVGH